MPAFVAVLVFGATIAALPTQANDSTAEFSNGGLIFVTNDDVQMRSETIRAALQRAAHRLYPHDRRQLVWSDPVVHASR
jgi:hypothetical protein